MAAPVRSERALERVVGTAAPKLARLGITSIRDLLYYFPRRYQDVAQYSSLADLREGEYGTVIAEVVEVGSREARNRPLTIVSVTITDGQARAEVVFFGRKRGIEFAIRRALKPGTRVEISGVVDRRGAMMQFKNASYEVLDPQAEVPRASGPGPGEIELRAVYPATAEVPTAVIRSAVELVLTDLLGDLDGPVRADEQRLRAAGLADPIPAEVRERHGLPGLALALRDLHRPGVAADHQRAEHRMRFEEAFVLQAALARRRADVASREAVPRPARPGGLLESFDAALPFDLTEGQQDVAGQITADLSRAQPMQRLLQGEVGSGKTVVAIRAMLQVIDAGGQAALLAPTEVLAHQHARTVESLLGPLGRAGMLDAGPDATGVALLTGSLSAAQRRQALAQIASGAAGIVIGTHALLEDRVQFADLGLTVVDEQHRFGVEQRQALQAKSARVPHQLFMTATPIPRSVAMTVFGDVEVSTLREIPAGRSPVTTHVVPARHPRWLARTWARVAEEIAQGRRAYVVAPRISATTGEDGAVLLPGPAPGTDASGILDPGGMSNVVDVAAGLAREPALSGVHPAVLHGRLPTEEKDAVMAAFADGRAPLLVTTTVIEVGVDVPEASVMVILDADRFGLSQLHQLRGRVGRGSAPGWCLLVTGAEPGTEAYQRVQILERTTDGFVLSEQDLRTRREGDILGNAQSGRTGSLALLRVIADADLIALARTDARALVQHDPALQQHPDLAAALNELIDPDREEYLDRA